MSTATDLIENASGMKAAQLSRRHFVAGMGALGGNGGAGPFRMRSER